MAFAGKRGWKRSSWDADTPNPPTTGLGGSGVYIGPLGRSVRSARPQELFARSISEPMTSVGAAQIGRGLGDRRKAAGSAFVCPRQTVPSVKSFPSVGGLGLGFYQSWFPQKSTRLILLPLLPKRKYHTYYTLLLPRWNCWRQLSSRPPCKKFFQV